MSEFYYSRSQVTVPLADPTLMEMAAPYPHGPKLDRYTLGCRFDDGGEIRTYVYPSIGFKASGLRFNGVQVEPAGPIWDGFLHHLALWGAPIMFPTPNRVRDGVYTFRGQTVTMEKYGRPRFLHGLTYDSQWIHGEPEILEDGVRMEAYVEIRPGEENYPAYPFHCRLTCVYHLTEKQLLWTYRLENLDKKPLPYGIGVHPYLMVHQDSDDTTLQMDVRQVYEAGADCLPTGKRTPTDETEHAALKQGALVRDLALDTVFTVTPGKPITVTYPRHGFRMDICSSEEFGHAVIHNPMQIGHLPKALPWIFAVENQTCCTDAINLHDQGDRETGLLILNPGETAQGQIAYRFTPIP